MAVHERVTISPKVLRWARERAGLDVETLVKRVSKKYPLWENGEGRPSVRQLEKIAKVTHVGLGQLYFEEPPDEGDLLPDLRTAGSKRQRRMSPGLLDTIYHCLNCQDWYHDHLVREGYEPLGFVGSATPDSNPEKVAGQIRQALRLDSGELPACKSCEEALAMLAAKSEEAGVMVMINGNVGSNGRRSLCTDEFRGFAISDGHAPLVFVNGRDAKSAQTFTLAHELAHIWLGKSGISNYIHSDRKGIEAWCGKVAAKTLVPAKELIREAGENGDAPRNVAEAAERLSRRFKVSRLAAIACLHEEGLISRREFDLAFRTEKARQSESERKVPKGIGPASRTRFRQMTRRCGYRFSRAMLSSTLSGETMYTDGMDFLGIVQLTDLDLFAKQFGLIR